MRGEASKCIWNHLWGLLNSSGNICEYLGSIWNIAEHLHLNAPGASGDNCATATPGRGGGGCGSIIDGKLH